MRVYVAGRWTRRAEVASVMRALEARGHVITHDWTVKEDSPEMPADERAAFYRVCARADEDGVWESDAFVLMHDPGCRGAFVEFGIALGARTPVVVVGAGVCPVTEVPIFYYLPGVKHVANADEAITYVDAMAAGVAWL